MRTTLGLKHSNQATQQQPEGNASFHGEEKLSDPTSKLPEDAPSTLDVQEIKLTSTAEVLIQLDIDGRLMNADSRTRIGLH